MTRESFYGLAAYVSGVMLSCLFMVLAFSIYQTLADIDPPYTAENFEREAIANDRNTVLTYRKMLHVTSVKNIQLYRAVACEGYPGFRYDFPLNMREFKIGKRTMQRRLIIPHRIEPGTKCAFTVYYEWRPTLAWYNKYVMLPDMEFVVK
jgi:hypothetical protein